MAVRRFPLVVLVAGLLAGPLAAAETDEWPAALAKSAGHAVVTVMASGKDGEEKGQGSGFLVGADGLVVTNYHVIRGMEEALIRLDNGSYLDVTGVVRKSLPLTARDLVILKCDARNLPFLELAGEGQVTVGEAVAAMGSPLGLEATLSTGVVSATRKLGSGVDVIQTSAPISPGSSGGPLFRKDGKVIGVTSASLSEGQNLNFAVAVAPLQELLAGLDEGAKEDLVALAEVPAALSSAAAGGPGAGNAWSAPTDGLDIAMRMLAIIDNAVFYSDPDRPGLAGLKEVDVVVADLDEEEVAAGLTTDYLDSYVELALRKSDIVKVSENAQATLYVDFGCFEADGGNTYYTLNLELSRAAVLVSPTRLDKDGKAVAAWANVWRDGTFGVCATSTLRKEITDLCDTSVTKLLNEIRKANPPRQEKGKER
jgi:S1-C subfamily serine protease